MPEISGTDNCSTQYWTERANPRVVRGTFRPAQRGGGDAYFFLRPHLANSTNQPERTAMHDAAGVPPGVGFRRMVRRGGGDSDRGYGEQSVDDDLQALGVRHVVIPRKGKPGRARQIVERRPAFRRTIKWRTGCEGRISTLKRGYGLDRSRIDGTEGAKIWVGHGVLAHNLVKIAALTA